MKIDLSKLTDTADIDRKQAWLTAWVAVATSDSCRNPDVPAKWADRCLKEFDERFSKKEDGQ